MFGTPIGSYITPLLPSEMPIISLQAPDLLRDLPVSSIRERSLYYLNVLVSELGDMNRSIHLVGYSLSGPLAFDLALCTKDSTLNCESICLIDPTPPLSIGSSYSKINPLLQRAKNYDSICQLF
jgi:thioesterase domain-containing protein